MSTWQSLCKVRLTWEIIFVSGLLDRSLILIVLNIVSILSFYAFSLICINLLGTSRKKHTQKYSCPYKTVLVLAYRYCLNIVDNLKITCRCQFFLSYASFHATLAIFTTLVFICYFRFVYSPWFLEFLKAFIFYYILCLQKLHLVPKEFNIILQTNRLTIYQLLQHQKSLVLRHEVDSVISHHQHVKIFSGSLWTMNF